MSDKNSSITFAQWRGDTAPDWIYVRGTGRANAWEYGAKAALGANDYGHIYHRADCERAEADGRAAAKRAVSAGVVILCPYCQRPFPACLEGARP